MTISNEYAAGFFDGEGTVYAATRRNGRRPSPTIIVCISNTDRRPIEQLKAQWGGSIFVDRRRNPRHRVQYQWTMSTQTAYPFLRAISPHLIIKAALVREAICVCELMQLPAHDRLDYSQTIVRNGRRWVSSKVRPEFMERVNQHWTAIRELNARGFNATREARINASAYGPNPAA